jgi:hypothetical protein
MKTTSTNTQSNRSAQPSKPIRIGLPLTFTATFLCGLALVGLSTYSIAQAQTTSAATADHSGWAQIPGELIRPDCVHEIPNGATVEFADGEITGDVTLNGVLIAHYEPCPEAPISTRFPGESTENLVNTPGTGNGWVVWSEWLLKSSDNIDLMAGTWTVPSNPSNNGALIYLFNGIENSTANWILQPVLQYGVNSLKDSGNFWGIASWLVGTNGWTFVSPLEKVHPGDSISGSMEQETGGSAPYWYVLAYDNTTGAYSWIYTHHVSGVQWTYAVAAVLEVKHLSSCDQFPANGNAVFTNSGVDDGYPEYIPISPLGWHGVIAPDWTGPSCGFGFFIIDGDSSLEWVP